MHQIRAASRHGASAPFANLSTHNNKMNQTNPNLAANVCWKSCKRSGLVCLGLGLSVTVGRLDARPVPQNLAGGLDKLVESNLILKAAAAHGAAPSVLYNGYATQEAANYAALAIQDSETKRFLVDIHPSGRVPLDRLIETLEQKFSSFTFIAKDTKYKGVGVIEGYIGLDEVAALGNMREV